MLQNMQPGQGHAGHGAPFTVLPVESERDGTVCWQSLRPHREHGVTWSLLLRVVPERSAWQCPQSPWSPQSQAGVGLEALCNCPHGVICPGKLAKRNAGRQMQVTSSRQNFIIDSFQVPKLRQTHHLILSEFCLRK